MEAEAEAEATLKQRLAELERREKEVAKAEQDLEWNRTNHYVIARDLEEQLATFEHQVLEVREKSERLEAELRQLEGERREVEAERARLERDRLQVEADRHFLRVQRAHLCDRFEEVLARVARAAAI